MRSKAPTVLSLTRAPSSSMAKASIETGVSTPASARFKRETSDSGRELEATARTWSRGVATRSWTRPRSFSESLSASRTTKRTPRTSPSICSPTPGSRAHPEQTRASKTAEERIIERRGRNPKHTNNFTAWPGPQSGLDRAQSIRHTNKGPSQVSCVVAGRETGGVAWSGVWIHSNVRDSISRSSVGPVVPGEPGRRRHHAPTVSNRERAFPHREDRGTRPHAPLPIRFETACGDLLRGRGADAPRPRQHQRDVRESQASQRSAPARGRHPSFRGVRVSSRPAVERRRS